MTRTVWLVARRELTSRVRRRSFLFGTAATIAVLAGYLGVMLVFSLPGTNPTVGFVGQAASVARPLENGMAERGRPIEIHDVVNADHGKHQVRSGELDAVVVGAPDALTLVVGQQPDQDLRAALDAIVRQQALDAELAKNGINPFEVRSSINGARVSVTNLDAGVQEQGQRLAMAMVVGALLYMFLITGGQAVAHGVVEEKSSRVIELLLATIRPAQLLAGKVFGIGMAVLAQFGIIAALSAVVAVASGVVTLPPLALADTVAWSLVWFVLGFFSYATILAATASLVSRMEELQGVLTPVTLLLVVPFVVGVSTLPNDPRNPLGTVLSFVPGFAPTLMPMRIALNVAAPWEILLAVALSLAALVGLLRLGGRVYANAVPHTGARVRLTDALR